MESDVSGPIWSPPWSCSGADGPGSPLRGAEPSRTEPSRTEPSRPSPAAPASRGGTNLGGTQAALPGRGRQGASFICSRRHHRARAGGSGAERNGTERNAAAQCCRQCRGSADGCEPTLSTAGAARLCASPSSVTRREEPGEEQQSGVTAMAPRRRRAVPCCAVLPSGFWRCRELPAVTLLANS